MPLMLQARLSLMMFLQYFMFGAWLVTLGGYMSQALKFDSIIGTAYGMQGFATIVSTLLIGALADRVMQAQKLLALMAFLSALSLFALGEAGATPTLFLMAVALQFLCFVPTIPLSNAIALHCATDRSAQFPFIRVWGTAGWIVAGLVVGSIPGAGISKLPLQLGGVAGLLLSIYALTLPAVPPSAKAGERLRWADLLGLEMLKQLRHRDFALFIAGVFVILLPLGFYNTYTNNFLVELGAAFELFGRRFEPAAVQTLGQFAEFALLLLLPFFLRRFGVKGVLVIGMAAWALRYVFFAQAAEGGETAMALLVAGILLHGICYDFFFVAGQIYVDERFDASLRVRAQAFLVFINMGVGVIIASNVANFIYTANTDAAGMHNWHAIWLIPAVVAFVAAIVFAVLFRQKE